MGSIRQKYALGTGWPGEQALRQLVVNTSRLYGIEIKRKEIIY
jgi:hypothetical protein